MISLKESIKILNSLDFKPVGVQKLFLTDALNRILAEDIIASENDPKYPTAAMDGYAIRFEDQKLKRLKVIAKNPAGNIVSDEVKRGVCIKTFTGSLMPKCSDTLIPIEHVEVDKDTIVIKKEVEKGFSVRDIGENYKKGEVLIKKGTQISFSEIGVLASLNQVFLKVYQKPKVAILSTGSEVLELGEIRKNSSQIRSSNNYTLESLVTLHGGEPIQLGAVKDDKKSIVIALREALDSADMVITTGGVSVGDYDFVKDVIKDEIEAKVAFKGVIIKPGQHIMVAKKDNKAILALPGFAYSSSVTFLIYALPILYKLKGAIYRQKVVKATLREDFKKRSKKSEFTACNIYLENGEYFVDFKGKKNGTSAILTNMLGEVGLIMTSEDEKDKKATQKVNVWLIK